MVKNNPNALLDGNSVQQVADRLERDIRSGGYLPGSKLLSMRTLSEKMQTDRNIIRGALDRLEAKGVVTKEARKGVFVSPGVLSGGLQEIYIFAHCYEGTGQISYIEQALELHRHFEYRRKFNVTLRYVGWGGMTTGSIHNEILKAKAGNAAVLVVSGAVVDRERIAILKESGLPFIVIGETNEDLPGLEFNQVYASFAARGLDVGNYLARSPYREIAYFTVPENTMSYIEEYIRILRRYVEEAGKKFTLRRLNSDADTERRRPRYYEAAVRELLESGARPDLLHFSDTVDVKVVSRIAGEFGLRVPEDINILASANTMQNPIPGILVTHIDYQRLADEIFELCGKLASRSGGDGKHNLTHLITHKVIELNIETILELFY